jgi:hypothetical protein
MLATKQCPCCGRPYPVSHPTTQLFVGGFIRQRIVNFIAERPEGVERAELMDHVYAGTREGGPPTASNVISVLIHEANRRLAPQGYRIASSGGHGSRYYLEDLHGDSVEQPA